jgi:hypothetical protein
MFLSYFTQNTLHTKVFQDLREAPLLYERHRRNSMTTMSEEAITYLEEHIPEMAEIAMKQAYWQTLASGASVLVTENGCIMEVFPDGTKRFVKTIEPRVTIDPTKIFLLP